MTRHRRPELPCMLSRLPTSEALPLKDRPHPVLYRQIWRSLWRIRHNYRPPYSLSLLVAHTESPNRRRNIDKNHRRRSPSLTSFTPLPTLSTIPTASCPGI